MTAARCSGGITADSARSAPRNATPNPPPPMIAPAQNSADGVRRRGRARSAPSRATGPATRRPRPPRVPCGRRAVAPTAPEPARAKIASPVTRWLDVWNSDADSDGPERQEQPADRPRGDHGRARPAGTGGGPPAGSTGAATSAAAASDSRPARASATRRRTRPRTARTARRTAARAARARTARAPTTPARRAPCRRRRRRRWRARRPAGSRRGCRSSIAARGRAQRQPGRDALNAARHEQPGHRRREHEQHRRHQQRRPARRAAPAAGPTGRSSAPRAISASSTPNA